MISINEVNLTQKDYRGWNIIHRAIIDGHLGVIKAVDNEFPLLKN